MLDTKSGPVPKVAQRTLLRIYDIHQSGAFSFDVSYSHVLTGLPGNTQSFGIGVIEYNK